MPDTQSTLNRTISLPLLVFYGVGTILGAGIYVLAGKVAGESGLMTPYAFVCASIVVSCSAHSYAQLSKHFPASAGEAVYILEVLRQNWLAVVIGWAIMFTGIVSSATIAKGFAAYIEPYIPLQESLSIPILIIALGGLAIWGVGKAVWFAAVLTCIEMFGIGLIIYFAAPQLPDFIQANPEVLSWPDFEHFPAIVFGAFLAFYAFIGFEDIVNMAEEVKNPRRNVALAIYLSLIITTLIYFITALSLMALLPMDQLTDSSAPFAEVAKQQAGISLGLITFISLAAITNGALVQIIMASRVLFGMAKRNLAPAALAKVSKKTQTPVLASIVIVVIIIIFALALPITTLAKTTSTVVLLIFALINVSHWVFEWKHRTKIDSSLLIKLFFPSLGVLLCLGFLLIQIKNV